MAQWTDVNHWEIQFPVDVETVVLQREGNVLRVHSGGKIDKTLQLTAHSSDVDGAIAELRRQFMASSSRYHPFFDNIAKRKELTYLLLVFFIVQQVFFFVYKRMHGKRVYALQLLNVIMWIVGGI